MYSTFVPIEMKLRYQDETFRLWGLPAGEDNIAWLLSHPSGDTLAVDAPAADPVLALLKRENLRLSRILLTHTHSDHTVGLARLTRETGCPPPAFPPTGEDALFSGLRIRVLETSGHSPADFSFHLPDLDLCFCGDTLFAGGCGRVFAGPHAKMWDSLLKLRNLPDATRLCMGHDYAIDNFSFARQQFPEMDIFARRLEEARAARERRHIFAPVTLGEEARGNPMLMSDHPDIAAALGLVGTQPAGIFTHLREMRNLF